MGAGSYFDVSATDRTLALAERRSPYTPYLEVDLDGSLDPGRLRTALDLVAERHAILTATLDADSWQSGWRPETTAPEFVVHDEPPPSDDAPGFFRALDAHAGPTCRLVYSPRPSGSQVVLGVSHAVCDARGLVVILDDLRRAYGRLESEDRPRLDGDWYPRTPAGLLEMHAVSRAEQLRMARAAWDRWSRVRMSTDVAVGSASGNTPAGVPLGRNTRLGPELSAGLRAAAGGLGVTLNHVLLAALACAWVEVVGGGTVHPSVSGWLVAVDGRRAFGSARGVGNLSAFEPVVLVGVESATLRVTAEAALREFLSLRVAGAGMTPDLAAMWSGSLPGPLANLSIEATVAGRSVTGLSRVFSHLDRFPDSFERWGDVTARGVRWSVVPPPESPLVLMMLTTFMGACELTSIAASDALSPAQARAISESLLRRLGELVDRGARDGRVARAGT
jgi:hypothetical protein